MNSNILTVMQLVFVCLFNLITEYIKACFQVKADFQQGRDEYIMNT